MRIAVLGGYGVGLSLQVPRVPGPGETVTASRLSAGPGGKGSNQAIAASRLGADVALLTAVGTDQYGADALKLWAEEGVNSQAVVHLPGSTMTGIILLEPSGENRIVIASGVLDELDSSHVERFRGTIADADILVVSLEIPVPAAVYALQVAREVGTATLVNPAPWSPLPPEAWDLIDVLTPNESEVRAITDRILDPEGTLDDALQLVREFYHAALLVTLGSRGVVVDQLGRRDLVPAPRPDSVMDSTGAGDAFTAALAVGLASGAALIDAATWATFAGAHAVQSLGVIPSLPRQEDLPALPLPSTSTVIAR